jgi:hypothetical protein
MTLEEYRVRLGWSRARFAREAEIDTGTLRDAIAGNKIYKATAGKIAKALTRALGYDVTIEQIEGLNFFD